MVHRTLEDLGVVRSATLHSTDAVGARVTVGDGKVGTREWDGTAARTETSGSMGEGPTTTGVLYRKATVDTLRSCPV